MKSTPVSLQDCSSATLTVRDAMTEVVIAVRPNAMVEEALERMLHHHVSGLPVTEEDGRLVGVLTEYDVLQLYRLSDDQYHPFEPCGHYMTTDVMAISPEATLEDATTILLQTHVRRLMVVDDESKLVGVLSRRDVARCLRDTRLVQSQLPWSPPEV